MITWGMIWNNRSRSVLTIMLILSVLLGLIILADGIYVYTLGGWPIIEDERLSHGIFRRMSTSALLIHSAIFYLIGMRWKQPRWSLVVVYPISLVSSFFAALVGFDLVWKDGAGGIPFLVVSISIPLLATFASTTRRSVTTA